jgi:RNA polymerase sigma-70 factor, ECF subfamily
MARPAGLQMTDEQLARRAQEGCRRSFEQLVLRYQVPLLRFITERVRCVADAEDLVQETFVRAYRRIDNYHDQWRFSTWLFTIAHRLAVSHLRSPRSRALAGIDQVERQLPPSATVDPGRDLMERENRQRFWETAAGVLSEEQLAAVWLFYVEGMGAKDVAEVLGRSWVSVKTMLFRARRKLESSLSEWSGERARPPVLSLSPAARVGALAPNLAGRS